MSMKKIDLIVKLISLFIELAVQLGIFAIVINKFGWDMFWLTFLIMWHINIVVKRKK